MKLRKDGWYQADKGKYFVLTEKGKNEVARGIEFDGQFFDSEKECYLYAMEKAYDMIEKDECLGLLEFIGC